MANGESAESGLQDKLRDQVSSSVREALSKSTTILSNLHRLSSYLDVMSAVSGVDSQGRLKSALEQIQIVRSDSASLLQTIYLGEIGLQSMQDVTKASTMPSVLPIFTDSEEAMDVNSQGDLFEEETSIGKRSASTTSEDQPSAKKVTVAVYTCHGCNRKFATHSVQGEVPTHCRNCRPPTSSATDVATGASTPMQVTAVSGTQPSFTSTPIIKKQLRVSKRKKLRPLLCKICGISFFYRRCLLRHIRECHAGIVDINDLQQYIHVENVLLDSMEEKQTSADSTEDSQSSQPSSLHVNIGSDISAQTSCLSVTDPHLEAEETEDVPLPSSVQQNQPTANVMVYTQGDSEPVESGSVSKGDGSIGLDSSLLCSQEEAEVQVSTNGALVFREFKCTVCDKSFDRPYRLTRHLEIHDPNRPRMPCNYCTKTFTRKDSLESHVRTAHTTTHPFTCMHEHCQRTFASRSIYLTHLKVHGETKPYHCQECSLSFTLLTELKEHLKNQHAETEELRCPECFKVCSSVDDRELHKLSSHRFECEICGKVFARMAYLHNHFKVHNGESKFNCRYCSEGFNSIYHYQQHLKVHPESRRSVNVYPCHTCGKTFQEPSNLVAHYQTPEHREKANAVGIPPTSSSTALSMMEGELTVHDLINEGAMKDSAGLMQSIVEDQAAAYEGIDPQDIPAVKDTSSLIQTIVGNSAPRATTNQVP